MNRASLSFKNNTATQHDLSAINNTLHKIGVNLSTFSLPKNLHPILIDSKNAPLNADQYQLILNTFTLDRPALLEQVALAHRQPAIPGGGALSTKEKTMPPYPKIYDLISMDAKTLAAVQLMFGKLHVNCADDGTGIDEVMSILCGECWIWFFRLPDNTIAKLTLQLSDNNSGFRLCYPGLTPHAAFVGKEGLCVAQAFGPEEWLTRYQLNGIPGSDLLNTNPWIDFETLTVNDLIP